MKYYLVIVNYNNCNVTIDCILSAGKLIEESFSKIVVVDNNSDGSDKEILRSFILKNVNLERNKIGIRCWHPVFYSYSWRISESNRRPFECHSNALAN